VDKILAGIAAIEDICFGPGVESQTRLGVFIELMCEGIMLGGVLPPEIFWPAFLSVWNACDCTWPYQRDLLRLLRNANRQSRAREYMGDAENANFFDDLPELIPVYRGCARRRIRGISWTTDHDVALKFARGIRFDREPDRVLVDVPEV
jgi:hypothetical protein